MARVAGKLHLISIHALREEGDRLPGCSRSVNMAFLSTPSARRATVWRIHDEHQQHISIHALREEGDASFLVSAAVCFGISIHALREEGDTTS